MATKLSKRIVSNISLVLLVLLLSNCSSINEDGSPKPPSGYLNETTLKISAYIGALELIDYKNTLVPKDIVQYHDIVYKTIDSTALKLDIFHGKNLSSEAPLIIFVHGGSWSGGDKKDYRMYTTPFAKKGYITASVQYRLSGVAKFPAQLIDVNDAIKFLKRNAADYHIDPSKIVLVGGSAGGHLVLLSAYSNLTQFNKNGDDGVTAEVQAVVDIYGPTDITVESLRDHKSIEKLMGKSYDEAIALYEKASPINYISKNAPPTLIFHGTIDDLVPASQSDILSDKLETLGVPVSYHRLKGWPHAMDVAVEVNDYLKYYMEDFFENHIPKN